MQEILTLFNKINLQLKQSTAFILQLCNAKEIKDTHNCF